MTDGRLTGSPGGIGFELALQLLSKGQTVVLGIRSPEKRLAATEQIESLNLAGNADVLDVDVADPGSISSAVRFVDEKYRR